MVSSFRLESEKVITILSDSKVVGRIELSAENGKIEAKIFGVSDAEDYLGDPSFCERLQDEVRTTASLTELERKIYPDGYKRVATPRWRMGRRVTLFFSQDAFAPSQDDSFLKAIVGLDSCGSCLSKPCICTDKNNYRFAPFKIRLTKPRLYDKFEHEKKKIGRPKKFLDKPLVDVEKEGDISGKS